MVEKKVSFERAVRVIDSLDQVILAVAQSGQARAHSFYEYARSGSVPDKEGLLVDFQRGLVAEAVRVSPSRDLSSYASFTLIPDGIFYSFRGQMTPYDLSGIREQIITYVNDQYPGNPVRTMNHPLLESPPTDTRS